MAQARFSLVLMSVLGGIALLLTAVGVFGVISYSVSQRTREFGIRLALGEDPRRTRQSVVADGMRLVLASIAIGLVGSLLVTRLMAGLLYHVRPADPLTFAGIGLLLTVVALLACYLPARRATRVDPRSRCGANELHPAERGSASCRSRSSPQEQPRSLPDSDRVHP